MSVKKIGLTALILCLGAGLAAAGMGLHRKNQRQAEREAYQLLVLAAAQTREDSQQFLSELEDESMAAAAVKAQSLSLTGQEEYRKAKAAASAGSSVSLNLGVFNASAYTGAKAGNISYWKSVNSDTIGWLRVPGTNIDYPVVQNTYDVNYYTHLGYNKQYSYYGVIWTNPNTRAGSSSNISSNTVLYGHNWTNVSAYPRIGYSNDIMFAQLPSYHWLSFARTYPYFYYSTDQEEMTFKVFAVFYTELSFAYNTAEGDMSSIIAEARKRSLHNFDVDVSASDKIVTLSTCTRAYGQTSNQRFVVMGRLLRPGETIEAVNVTANPYFKVPNVWG